MTPAPPTEPRLPTFSGLLLALAFPPFHLIAPAFLALAPLALWLERRAVDGSSGGEAFRGGLLTGVVAWGLLLHWIPLSLTGWSWMAVPAYLLLVTALAATTGGVAWAAHRMRTGAGVPVALGLPLAWIAGEFFRAHWPGPLAFPWLGLGVSLTGVPEWIGVAEVAGERGVGLWLALVAGLSAAALRSGLRLRSRAARLGAAAVVAVVVPAWGVARAHGLELRPAGRVAVVQPNVAQPLKSDVERVEAATVAALERAEDSLVRVALDVVVLPEALVPDPLDAPAGAGFRARLQDFSRRVGAPVVVGGLGRRPVDGALTNSVFLVDSAGLTAGRYDKRRLVPVVERLPLVPLPWFGEGFAGYVPGREWSVLRVGSTPAGTGEPLLLGAMVCYESTFPEVARNLRRAGADVLVNVTNDAWFGREPWYARTTALWQHPAHLVMRAVETRSGVVRAANTGISMIIDPVGRITLRTPLFEEAVAVGSVFTTGERTIWVRRGDVVGWGAFSITLMLVAWSLRNRVTMGRHVTPGGG